MAIVLGPVLGFRGGNEAVWQVGALVVTDGGEPSRLQSQGKAVAGKQLAEHKGRTVWRFDFEVQRGEEDTPVLYEVEGKSFAFTVPAAGRTPRMAYTSCNGFSSLKLLKSIADKYALWKIMAQRHAAAPFHLLLMGGDQVYADEMWETVEPLKRWNELPADKGNKAPFSAAMAAKVRDFYFDLYCRRWSQPELRDMLASVPTLMMWDDHDIFDGWGSYPPERQTCPVFDGIFALAREHFRLFQRQEDAGSLAAAALFPERGFTVGHRLGDLALLTLDMRSERTGEQVLSRDHWNAIYAWMDGLTGKSQCRHLVVMTSIPVLYPGFDMIEQALGILPGQQEIEDDLRDHWRSRPHKEERLRLLHRLLAFSEREKTRVTLVSGDVHVAALGILESTRSRDGNANVINQLIASGIVHPGPPGLLLFALEKLFSPVEEIDRGITAEMACMPGTRRRFLGGRNWLSLCPDPPPHSDQGRLWAEWTVEGEDHPYTKVIHAVEETP
ncbi:MAG TPA: alkaline phosphatase D family protein [Thermoanaerobaculia bacterium]